ncbi:MAG: potassium/proton antiporter [Gemmatimonadetes bacterium]|nr:potassium/proton antiporter [Gemmatimonadota bacterium]
MPPLELVLLVGSLLLALSVLASKATARLGIPSLLLFLVIGMLAGSDGPGGIEFDNPALAQNLGVVALAFILFAGGLDTDWSQVRPVFWPGFSLSTLGVLASTLAVGAFAAATLDFSWMEGLLLGAVVSSTDAAAVFGILRSRNVTLRRRIEALLELEAGSNDPMAVFLTVGFTGLLVDPERSVVGLVPMFAQQMILGGALGLGLGRLALWAINRVKLEYEGLYPVLTVALVLLVYGATASLGGNGFLAVYLTGLTLGSGAFIHRASLLRFHDGLAWLMQITMFLTLGLLVFPSRLPAVALSGLLVSGFLVLIARPASVFLSLAPFRIAIREKGMASWVGLRGAVPIVLATFPLLAGLPKASLLFDLVFFIVLTSVLIQGPSIPWVARRLGMAMRARAPRRYALEFVPSGAPDADLLELVVPVHSPIVGKQIVELGLPKGALIVVISRGDEWIIPTGSTVLEAGDALLLLADRATLSAIRPVLESE